MNKQPPGETDWARWALTDDHLRRLRQTISGELTTICLEFEALAWTLNRYASAGGSEMVIEFYQYRYRAVLTWLDAIGLLESHGQIQSFFKPKENYKYMVSNPSSQAGS